jgi:hypothetical protein
LVAVPSAVASAGRFDPVHQRHTDIHQDWRFTLRDLEAMVERLDANRPHQVTVAA